MSKKVLRNKLREENRAEKIVNETNNLWTL